MSAIDQIIGKRLRDARERRGLSVNELAVSLEIEPFRLESIEAGVGRPEGRALVRHAHLLGLDLPDLFSGFEPDIPAQPIDCNSYTAQERSLINLLHEHAEQTSPEMRTKLLMLADELSQSGANAGLIDRINLEIRQISLGRPPPP